MLYGTFEHEFRSGRLPVDLRVSATLTFRLQSKNGRLLLAIPSTGCSSDDIRAFLSSPGAQRVASFVASEMERVDLRTDSSLWKQFQTTGVSLSLFGQERIFFARPSSPGDFEFTDEHVFFGTDGRGVRGGFIQSCRNAVENAGRIVLAKIEKDGGPSGCVRVDSGMWEGRWGQCSSDGVISLDWRAVFLPRHLFEHLVSHEACHLIHMNHSISFWRLLRKIRSECDKENRELDKARTFLPLF